MSHHGSEDFSEIWKRYFNQNPEEAMSNSASDLENRKSFFGATGEFPDGKLTDKDEGQIKFGIAVNDGKLIINFGNKPITWIGFTKDEVVDLIKYLNNRISELK